MTWRSECRRREGDSSKMCIQIWMLLGPFWAGEECQKFSKISWCHLWTGMFPTLKNYYWGKKFKWREWERQYIMVRFANLLNDRINTHSIRLLSKYFLPSARNHTRDQLFHWLSLDILEYELIFFSKSR